MKTIIYLHGFGSSGQSNTVAYLRKLMPECRVVAPDIPVDPKDALPFLIALCEKENPDLIIGTSMGAMYAMQLWKYPRICVNPALRMSEQSKVLKIGTFDYFHPTASGEIQFTITEETMQHFRDMEQHLYDNISNESRHICWGFFGDEDTTANCKTEFQEHFAPNVIDFHGGHRMNNKILKEIIVPFAKSVLFRGLIEIFHEDCLDFLPKLEENSVDCLIVDLPYYQVVKDDFDNQWNNEDEYLEWVEECLVLSDEVLKPNANVLIFASRQQSRHIANICEDVLKWNDVRTIIWARKRGFNNTRGHALASGYEPILHFCKGEDGTFNNVKIKVESSRKEYTEGTLKDGITLSDVWTDIPALPHNSKEKVNHPTQKPIKLMERLVSLYTNEGDTVLDFCMGSGSTGVACKNLNRNFIGVENNEEYFKIAKNRLESWI